MISELGSSLKKQRRGSKPGGNEWKLTLSGRVLAPSSLKASLKRLFSPLFRANLMAIGVSEDGVGLTVAMMAVVLLLCKRLRMPGKRAGQSGSLRGDLGRRMR